MREQLMITTDGIEWVEADLDPNSAVTLQKVCGYGGDINSIGVSRSFTIKMPKTKRNIYIFEDAGAPQYEGQSHVAYSPMGCRWLSEGIEIIHDGMVHVTSADEDAYSVVIVWGCSYAFSVWAKAGKKLRDLIDNAAINWDSDSMDTDWGVSSTTSCYDPMLPAMWYALYKRGYTDGTMCHPCVTLREVFEKIKKDESIDIEVDDPQVLASMEDYCLVLTPNNNEEVLDLDITESSPQIQIPWGMYMPSLPVHSDGAGHVWHESMSIDSCVNSIEFKHDTNDGCWFEVLSSFGDLPTSVKLVIHVGYISSSLDYYTYEIVCQQVSGDASDAFYEIPDGVYDLKYNSQQGDWLFYIDIDYFGGTPSSASWDDGFMVYHYQDKRTEFGDLAKYRLVPNLPDISQIDYIKAICHQFGLFAVQGADGKVHLVQFDKLYGNMGSNHYDWSKYVVDAPWPDANEVKFDAGYALENTARYKVDDKDISFMDSHEHIYSESQSDSVEGTFFEQPWAATDRDYIIQYYQDGGKAKFEELVHRIMKHKQTIGSVDNSLTFDYTLDMPNVVHAYWNNYARTIRYPKVITIYLRLNPYDYETIDFTRPIYLQQFGRFYCVKTLTKTSGSDVIKAELLQLAPHL